MLSENSTTVHVPLETKAWPVDGWMRLEDLCEGVFDCPHSTPIIVDAGPYVVRSQNIRSGVFRLSEATHVSDAIYQERIARAEPRSGDLLYSREGTYFGIAAEIPPGIKVCLGQRMVLIRPDANRLSATFLRYWLNSPTMARHIHGFRDGTVAERLNLPVIRGLPIPVLCRRKQEAIAEILRALDDKIGLNQRMSETLEAMARAVFKDWFVDFGPARAKMEGRVPYLAPEIWSLFPDLLDNDGKPQGWEACPLSSMANLARDGITPASFSDELFDHYSLPAFDAQRTPVREAGASILSNKSVVPANAVLISKLNPEIPRVWFVDTDGAVRNICSTEFLVLTPRVSADRAWLYCLLTEASFRQRLESMVTGTSRSHQRVNVQSVMALDVITATRPIMGAFRDVAARLLARMTAGGRESRDLAAMRDLLLPKLMSGEIRVRDAEKIAEAAK